jgi:hypothetical protein
VKNAWLKRLIVNKKVENQSHLARAKEDKIAALHKKLHPSPQTGRIR